MPYNTAAADPGATCAGVPIPRTVTTVGAGQDASTGDHRPTRGLSDDGPTPSGLPRLSAPGRARKALGR
ncbi:hypothetical protein ACFQX6_22860 [Streptosporangium lutulentum]